MSLEEAAQRVLAAGLSTGHADTWDQLLDEVIDQALDYRGRLMACRAAEELTPRIDNPSEEG